MRSVDPQVLWKEAVVILPHNSLVNSFVSQPDIQMSTLGVTYRATTGKRNQVLQDFRTCLCCAAQLTSVVFCIFRCYCSVPCFLASCKAVFTSWHSTTSCSPFTATSQVPLTSENGLPRSKIKGRFHSSLLISQVMKSYRL